MNGILILKRWLEVDYFQVASKLGFINTTIVPEDALIARTIRFLDKKSCEATDRYIEKHKEDAFYLHIKSYTDDRNYFNQYDVELMPRENNKKKYPYIGYYKDIFFFYRMNELTMRALKERAKEGNKNE